MRKEDLKALLERAYEEGWRGCLEMKDEVASRLANEYSPSSAFENVQFTVATNDYENVVSPHYFYSTMTAPPVEMVRRDEVL